MIEITEWYHNYIKLTLNLIFFSNQPINPEDRETRIEIKEDLCKNKFFPSVLDNQKSVKKQRHDTHQNDTQHNDIQHNRKWSILSNVIMLGVILLCVVGDISAN